MKNIWLIALLLNFSVELNAQELTWTSFEELNYSQQKQARPLLIFIHTQWCRFCEMQKEISFKDPDLIRLLNDNFYCIELDAESKQNIEFQGTTYKFNYLEGYHQLPLTLTKELDQLVVPSIVIMNNNLDIHSVLHSYQQPKYLIHHLEQLLLN